MPVSVTSTTAVGFDSTIPDPFAQPTPVVNFRWDAGTLKWDKDSASIMTGGSYHIQYSDDNGSTWTDLGDVNQVDITTTTGTYQDAGGSPDRVYQIKKVTSTANGTKSSIYVGYDTEYEDTDDKCYVMILAKDIGLGIDTGIQMKIKPNVASSVSTYLNYKNKTIVPVLEKSVAIEPLSGLLIMPVIPSEDITLPTAGTAVKYNITITGKNGFTVTFEDKTVPKASSAWVRDLV